MITQQFLYLSKIVICLLLFILVGCTGSAPLSTSSLDDNLSTASATVSSQTLSTPTPQIVGQKTLAPTFALTSTPTSTILPTTPPTMTAPVSSTIEMPTPIPTPPGLEPKEQVLWLYETNNGCQLPCWWGIVPGQTEWSVAQELLNRFDQDIYKDDSTTEEIYYEVDIPLPLEVFIEDGTILAILARNDIVEIMDTDVSIGDTPPGYLSQYTLPAFLTTYGQPAEVWLSTYTARTDHNDLPFRMLLFYPDQGIMALFNDSGVKEGDIVWGCPQQDPVRALSLWSPTLGLTFEQVKSGFAIYNTDYLPLQEAAAMDVADFYEIFKNPSNVICLETPAELWPYVG